MGHRVFVPGLAVRGSLYRPGLPDGWQALDPPPLGRTRGRFDACRRWLLQELVACGPQVTLAGHSMGAALAITAAAERPDLVERLVLLSPSGLPLSKPMRDSFALVVRQALEGLYPPGEVAFVVFETVKHPRLTYRLAREAHDLDLREDMTRVARAHVPCLVVGYTRDTLTTPVICRAIADALGADFRQIEGSGHMWMLRDWPGFRALLAGDAR